MAPSGFINGQDESIFYVNSSLQVYFSNIFFRHLILNINCDKKIDVLDESEDEIISNIQKIMIMRVIQRIFCEILIGESKIVLTDSFFKVTNIRMDVRNYSS